MVPYTLAIMIKDPEIVDSKDLFNKVQEFVNGFKSNDIRFIIKGTSASEFKLLYHLISLECSVDMVTTKKHIEIYQDVLHRNEDNFIIKEDSTSAKTLFAECLKLSQAILGINLTTSHYNFLEYPLKGLPIEFSQSKVINYSKDKVVYYLTDAEEPSEYSENYERKKGYVILYPELFKAEDKKSVRKYYNKIYDRFKSANKKSAQLSDEVINESKGYLYDGEDTLPDKSAILLEDFSIFDALAIAFQKKTIYFLKLLLFFSLSSFLWFSFYDQASLYRTSYDYIILFTPIFFIISLIILKYVEKKNIENCYYDFRIIAEALRIKFFWSLVNIKMNPFIFLSQTTKRDILWGVECMNNISSKHLHQKEHEITQSHYQMVYKYWICDQLNYFDRQVNSLPLKIKIKKVISILLLSMSMVIAIILYWGHFYEGILIYKDVLVFSVDLFFAIGAIYLAYIDKRSFESHYNLCRRMWVIYKSGKKQYEEALDAKDYETLDMIIKQLGNHALRENEDWFKFNKANTFDLSV